MLPEDADWYANDGNEPITHDWVNKIEQSVDMLAADGTTVSHPVKTGTTIPWGGGRWVFWELDTGIATGADGTVDASVDWRNRLVLACGHAWNAGSGSGGLPGEGSEPASQPGGDYSWTPVWGYLKTTGADAGNPPANCTYLQLSANIWLFVADATGALTLRNNTGGTIYPALWVMCSDQFPTRVT